MKKYAYITQLSRYLPLSSDSTFPCQIGSVSISCDTPSIPPKNKAYAWKDNDWILVDDFSETPYYNTSNSKVYIEFPNTPTDDLREIPWTKQELIDAGKLTLADIKNTIKRAIDAKTDSIIAAGYTFDGNIFSLSTEAQLNWTGLKNFIDNGMVTFPLALSTKDDKEYSLEQADVTNFFVGMFQQITGAVDSGRALKLQVNAMKTLAALEAFVDPR